MAVLAVGAAPAVSNVRPSTTALHMLSILSVRSRGELVRKRRAWTGVYWLNVKNLSRCGFRESVHPLRGRQAINSAARVPDGVRSRFQRERKDISMSFRSAGSIPIPEDAVEVLAVSGLRY